MHMPTVTSTINCNLLLRDNVQSLLFLENRVTKEEESQTLLTKILFTVSMQ